MTFRNRRFLPILAVLGALGAPALAQRQFAEDVTTYMPNRRDPGYAIAAADVNGDGHTDVFVGNNPVSSGWQNSLYLGDGTGRFADVTATHLPVGLYRTSGIALGDVDGDGDVDVVTANEYSDQNQLYLNDGAGVFAEATFGRLPADVSSCRDVVLADLDGDGDLDMVFAAYRQDLLYLNDGTGVFTDVTATHMVPNATSTWDVAAADIDGDGDVDLVLAEQNGHALLLNDGNAQFADVTAAQLPAAGAQCLAVAFGDVDGDGDADLVSGYWQSAASIYLNDGSGNFNDATSGKLSTSVQSVEDLVFADIDADGDADLVVAGWGARYTGVMQLFQNDGGGAFTDVTAAQLLSGETNAAISVFFGDADGDGDVDLFAAGYWTRERLLLNDGAGTFADTTPNRLPSVWDVPWDLALADLDGDGDKDLVSANGFIDWQSWPNRLHLNDGYGSFTDVTVAHLPDDTDDSRAVAAADVDQDGDTDLVFGNFAGQNVLYLNDGAAVFTDVTLAQMPAVSDATTSLAMGDVDGDGDPDLVVGNHLEQTALYLNDGAGTLIDGTAGGMPSSVHETRDLVLGDVDGDGDADLVIVTGLTRGEQNLLYLNDGLGVFSDVTATHMPIRQRASASVDLGDVDGDGDLDIVIGNEQPGGFGTTNALYVNDGTGVFAAGYAGLMYDLDDTLAIAVADVDEDGDLDVFCGDYVSYNKLYLNDGTATYRDGSNRMPGTAENARALAVGDVDGDGDVDLVVGSYGAQQVETVVYPNRHRQLAAPRLAAIGATWALDVHSRAGYATAPQTAAIFLGFAPASIPLPQLGTLGIDPTTMLALPPIALAPPAGTGTAVLPIPALPALVGITLYAQALVVPSPSEARLTNVLKQRIHAF